MPNKLLLLEYYEFLTFVVDFLAVTEPELKLLILQNLNHTLLRFSILFLLDDVRLQVSQLLEALLGALNHQVSRLLERYGVLCLRDLDVPVVQLLHLGVGELLWVFLHVW